MGKVGLFNPNFTGNKTNWDLGKEFYRYSSLQGLYTVEVTTKKGF
jgi:hypothetical protein